MNSLTSSYQSAIRFRGGDYWINGNVELANETVISRQGGGSDPVKIFVNGDVTVNWETRFLGFEPGGLLIYATGNIRIDTRQDVSALLYAEGTVTTDFNSRFTGAISGTRVNLGQSTIVSYSGAQLAELDLAPFCGPGLSPAATLVAHWKMDERLWSGGTADVVDVSGNDNNGTAEGGASTDNANPARPGDPGTCGYGQFDGTNDYVSVPNLSEMLNRTASLAFWIKTTQTGNDTAWQAPGVTGVEQNGGANDIFWGWLDASGRIGLAVGNDSNTKSTNAINTGAWRHVVLIRDTDAGQYQVYVDGVLDNSGSISAANITTAYRSLGRIEDTAGSPEYFQGDLDEVRIYNGVLTAGEVNEIYNAVHPCSSTVCPAGTARTGLSAEYFTNRTLSGEPEATSVDGPVYALWEDGEGPVALEGRDDNFSVRWEGQLHITETDDYRFRTYSDDGVRLWVDGQRIINNWSDHSVTENTSSQVPLEADQSYDIRLEFYENGGRAEIQLLWSAGGAFTLIPSGNRAETAAGLYHCSGGEVASYLLEHSANGVTCEAEPVRVTALDQEGNSIAPAAGTTITLAPSQGTDGTRWVDENTYVFSGSEDFTIKYLRQTSPAELNLSVDDGNAVFASGPITFTDTALRFYDSRDGNALPSQVAGEKDGSPVLRVVRTDDETGSCEARIDNETRAVGLGFECVNPGACVAGQTLTLNSTSVTPNNAGTGPLYTQVELAFDDEGYANIPFNYTDVGTLRLLGQLELREEDEQPAISLEGNSNEFVVKPHTLAVVGVTDAAGNSNPGTTSGGGGFIASGESFEVTVESRNSQGNLTPNFGNESPAQSARIELTTLEYPNGGSIGELTGEDNFNFESGGRSVNQSLTWNNVGAIRLTPRLRGDDYQSSGDIPEVTESEPVGRFYPFDFALGGATVTDACGAFSYMMQGAINVDYTINARNLSGGIVSNYDNTDQTQAYSDVAIISYVAENDEEGNGSSAELSARVSISDFTWNDGVLEGQDPAAIFLRAFDTSPDGPWESLQWGVQLTDPLDNRNLSGLDMNADQPGGCTAAGNCSAVALGDPLNLRFGRLRLNDAYGPEVVDLPVRFFTEYWNGSEFTRSLGDFCTRIPREAIRYPEGNLASDDNRTVTVGEGSTTGEYDDLTAAGVSFTDSDAGHLFTAPGRGNMGDFEVIIDLNDRPWLRYDWNQNGDHLDDILMPPATFSFGSYRGHDRIIYWREILE